MLGTFFNNLQLCNFYLNPSMVDAAPVNSVGNNIHQVHYIDPYTLVYLDFQSYQLYRLRYEKPVVYNLEETQLAIESQSQSAVGKLSSLGYFSISQSFNPSRYVSLLSKTDNYILLSVNENTIMAFSKTNFSKTTLTFPQSHHKKGLLVGFYEVQGTSTIYGVSESGQIFRWSMSHTPFSTPQNFNQGTMTGMITLNENEKIGKVEQSECGKYLALQIWVEGNKDSSKWGSVILKLHWLDLMGNLKFLAKIRQGVKQSKSFFFQNQIKLIIFVRPRKCSESIAGDFQTIAQPNDFPSPRFNSAFHYSRKQ